MYITCEKCNTTFRLDEKLLKRAGSKVRCSQCSTVFLALPPREAEAPVDGQDVVAAATGAPRPDQDTFDQELEGIDLAELDSILEKGKAAEEVAGHMDKSEIAPAEDSIEFDEADLDMDFESALEEDTPALGAAEEVGADADRADDDLDLDLDMDFELDDGEDLPAAQPFAQDTDSLEPDLDMDFELDSGDEDLLGIRDQDTETTNEDIDAALDDFGDVLGDIGDEGEQQLSVGETADNELDIDINEPSVLEEAESELDIGGDEVAADPFAAATGDPALDDLGGFLDADAGEKAADIEVEDVELSLPEETGGKKEKPARSIEPETASMDEGDDLGLGDLDDLLDEDISEEEQEPENVELSLDDNYQPGADQQAALAVETGGGDEDLDIGDLDDLLGEGEETTSTPVDKDMELSLDEEPEFSPGEKGEAGEDEQDEFDLGEFEDVLSDEAVVEGKDEELTLEDEPLLELEPETDAVAPLDKGDDDLDLSDLGDSLLEDTKEDASAESKEDLELSLDDMELSLEEEPEDEGAFVAGDDSGEMGELEELEFELDAEFEDKPISHAGESAAPDAVQEDEDEELDLTDIEQMLEDDTGASGGDAAAEASQMSLEPGGAEKWVDDASDDLGPGVDGEIDLSEIEEAIDAADQEPSNVDLQDAEELDLDIDIEPEPVENVQSTEEGEEFELELEMDDFSPLDDSASTEAGSDEFDLSDFDLSIEDDKTSVETETVDAGDIQLEFQVEDRVEVQTPQSAETVVASQTTDAAFETTDFLAEDEDMSVQDTVVSTKVPKKAAAKAAPKPKKKRGTSKFLVFLFFLIVLGAGGYYGYDYVVKNNIYIPYVSDYINPEAKDPSGVLQLSTTDINGKFIENEAIGRLFVVTGNVRSGYGVARKLIRIKGELYTKGKKLAKTEFTYAGLVVDDQQLSSKSIAEIKQDLNSTRGKEAAVTIRPGQSVPFMVVFSDLPADLDEYVINLVSSIKAQ